MNDSYITISSRSCEEHTINKSRFIGYAAPCSSESDALKFLNEIREEHKNATHHCYAYIIGTNQSITRYSDNGEPSGTAGLPILDVLQNRKIVNACVVVVRYFGGVLLGTGGLVRAYTQSSQSAVLSAGIAQMEMTSDESCELPYSVWDKTRYACERLPVRIENLTFGSSVCFHLLVRTKDREQNIRTLMETSGRKLIIHSSSKEFALWKMDQPE